METRWTKIFGFALLLAGLVLCGGGLRLLLSPAHYQATARIKVESDAIHTSGNGQNVSYDPFFIQTEFEVLQSQVVLSKVVGELNLNVEWGKKYAGGVTLSTNEAMAILKRQLDLSRRFGAPPRSSKSVFPAMTRMKRPGLPMPSSRLTKTIGWKCAFN